MSASVPTEFLLLVAQATPQQQEAIKRFLRAVPGELGASAPAKDRSAPANAAGLMEALLRVERKVDTVQAAVLKHDRRAPPQSPGSVTESEARRVFGLVERLEGAAKQWKAPLARVFRLTVLEGRSQAETSRLCACAPGLISRRVRALESRFGMSIDQLRSFASVIVEMETSVKGTRLRNRSEGAPEDDADARCETELGEDENGYLPGEGPDSLQGV